MNPPIIWYMPEIGLASATDPKGFHPGAVPYMLARPMPIETAPRDGQEILGWDGEWSRMYWDADDGTWVKGDAQYEGCSRPAFWLPLPPAPEEA